MAGPYVGFVATSCDGAGGSCNAYPTSLALRNGKRLYQGSASDPASVHTGVTALVTAANGSIAWIGEDDGAIPATYEVRKFDSGGQSTLDHITKADAMSLTLAADGGSISWTNASAPQTSPLS